MASPIIDKINKETVMQDRVAAFAIGDTVRIHAKIKEGEKERIQLFTGIVIARKGVGSTETFTVRRVAHGVGVERVFPIHSPFIAKMEVESSAHVRRSKLYYLRDISGKKAKLKEKIVGRTKEKVVAK
jgi:large subunit ribosomal protein L19